MSDLPPLDLAQAYVVVGPNDQRGPYTMELLISEVLAQRLSEATPVWWPGLADWTTMGGHPGVAAELQRRRAPAQPTAPVQPAQPEGWTTTPSAAPVTDPAPAPAAEPAPVAEQVADPAPVADPFAQQATSPFAQPSAPIAEPAAQVASTVPVEHAQGDLVDEPAEAATESSENDDLDVVDAEIIDVEVAVASVEYADHVEVYAALVARSRSRAERRAAVDRVDEDLVAAVSAGVQSQGFELVERNDLDRSHELRFDGPSSDLVVVSLGRPSSSGPEQLREDHLPLTLSYRTSGSAGRPAQEAGEHGDVAVAADEWTGQATGTVELVLGIEDYLDAELTVDADAVQRDIAAAVAVLRTSLS